MRGVDGPDLESYPMARPQSPVWRCVLSLGGQEEKGDSLENSQPASVPFSCHLQ